MEIEIRPLAEKDVAEADRIFRLAFGTFIGLPDPLSFAGDSGMVPSRWRAAPDAALGAYDGDTLLGSNFAARWGSFAFFGPLTVRPELWNQGVAKRLVAATMALFDRWGVEQRGLYTFPTSEKHHALYGKFAFAKQALTPVMGKAISGAGEGGWTALSALSPSERATAMEDIRRLTDAILPGLDVSGEIPRLSAQGLGDVVLLRDGAGLDGFAICHAGAGSEAGSDLVYVKFAAARPGPGAAKRFERLVAACEDFARARGVTRVLAGVNKAREEAHAMLKARGYATMMEGIAMQTPDRPGFNRPDCFVIDDWR
jgi:GNAT superfamily N-acetyltransferase